MQHTFRYNRTERYLMIILSLILAIIPTVLIIFDFSRYKSWGDIAFMSFSLLFPGSIAFIAWATHIWQLTVDDFGLHIKNWRRTRHIGWQEIKGYRLIMGKILSIEFVTPKRRPYTIQYALDDQSKFIYLLSQRFRNLEIDETIAEREALLHNEQFGTTEEERVDFLKNAQKTANSWSLIAVAVSALPLLVPRPSTIELLLPIIFPFVLLVVCFRSKGSITVFAPAKSGLPNIALGLFFGPMLYMLGAIFKNSILDYHHLLPPLLVIGLIYGGILYGCIRTSPKPLLTRSGLWIIISMLSFFYAIGSVIWTNRTFDRGEPVTRRAVILNKRWSASAFVFYDYYVKVNDWQPPAKPVDIELDRALYDRYQPGDSLLITVRPGFWGARRVEVVSEE